MPDAPCHADVRYIGCVIICYLNVYVVAILI